MKFLSRSHLSSLLASIHRTVIRNNNSCQSNPSPCEVIFSGIAHEVYKPGCLARYNTAVLSMQSSSFITSFKPSIGTQTRQRQTISIGPIHHPVSHLHTLQRVTNHRVLTSGDDALSCGHTTMLHVRHKSKKKQYDSGEDSDSDLDDNLDEDDFEAPSQFKVQTIHSPSLRIDAVLSKALGLGRHRLEEIFFSSGIFLNGKKLLKKAGKMEEGDYVDAVMEKEGDKVKVKRVKLLKVGSQRTSTDKLTLKVRIWKSPFYLDNPNKWRPQSDS